jgi:hypothetical protein
MLVVVAAWVIIALLLLGTAAVIWLGVDTVIRGWQLLEQLRRDREDEAGR